MQQVLINLIQNALKVSNEGQKVIIEVSEGEALVSEFRNNMKTYQIKVIDEGPGIEDCQLKELFQPYFR